MVTINPGIALGGAILGITPGAALEKKSVRDLAANFAANKIGKYSTPHTFNFCFLHDTFFMIFILELARELQFWNQSPAPVVIVKSVK